MATNHLMTFDWMSMELLKTLSANLERTVFHAAAIAPAVETLTLTIPPSLLVAGVVAAAAAKVPFSRRRLLMPWRVCDG